MVCFRESPQGGKGPGKELTGTMERAEAGELEEDRMAANTVNKKGCWLGHCRPGPLLCCLNTPGEPPPSLQGPLRLEKPQQPPLPTCCSFTPPYPGCLRLRDLANTLAFFDPLIMPAWNPSQCPTQVSSARPWGNIDQPNDQRPPRDKARGVPLTLEP